MKILKFKLFVENKKHRMSPDELEKAKADLIKKGYSGFEKSVTKKSNNEVEKDNTEIIDLESAKEHARKLKYRSVGSSGKNTL